MNKPKSRKQHERKETPSRKYAEPLHVDMPFDEFVARIVRVKPDKKSREWKTAMGEN